MAESSKEGEKNVLVIDMTRAREARRPQFFVVGLFLFVLLVNPKQLFDHMKKVWKIRGDLEVSSLESEAGKKFFLVFFSGRRLEPCNPRWTVGIQERRLPGGGSYK